MKYLVNAIRRFHLAIALLIVAPGLVEATDKYPTKPITIVVPFPAGGSPDIGMRLIQQRLSEVLGVPLVVLNKPGASGVVGMSFVASSPADGYTLAATTSSSITVVQIGNLKIPYGITDFIPIGTFAVDVSTLIVSKDSPLKDFSTLIDQAKARPGSLNIGTPGVGTLSSLNLSAIKDALNLSMLEVPFAGTPQVTTAILGNQVDAGVISFSGVAGAVGDGSLRSLVVGGSKRLASLPGVPTLEESGLKDGGLNLNLGIYAAKGTPENIINTLRSALKTVMSDRSVVAAIEKIGMVAEFEDGDQVSKRLEREHENILTLGKKLNLIKK